MTELKYISDVIKWELNPNFTRSIATSASGTYIEIGDILVGEIAEVFPPDNDSGSATTTAYIAEIVGIALEAGGDGDKILCIVRGPACVDENALDYGALDADDANAQLLSMGILVVDGATYQV